MNILNSVNGAVPKQSQVPGTDLKNFAMMIFGAAFFLRLAIAWKAGFFHHFEHDEMVRIALSLVKDREFGNPFLIHTGPTAHEMPLYPLFMAAIYFVCGTGALAEAVKIGLACSVSALRCALIPFFCVAANLSRTVAIIAGIFASLYIGALQTELRGNWDGPLQAIVLLILIWATVRIWRDQSWSKQIPWPYFVLWGIAILLQPAFLPILAAFMLAGLIACQRGVRRRYLTQCLFLTVLTLAFLSPWAIRNYFRLGKFVLTKDNFGLELWVSNGPGRAYDVQTNLGYRSPHPSTDLREAQKVLQLGEIRYNEMKLAEAENWIRDNPGKWARLTALRFLAFWFPPGRNRVHTAFNFSVTLLSFVGLGLLFRKHRLLATLFALTWLSFPPIYYIVQWSTKYRYPIDWQFVICGSVSLALISELMIARLSRNWGHSSAPNMSVERDGPVV